MSEENLFLILGISLILLDYFVLPLLLFPLGLGFIALALTLYLTNSQTLGWIFFSIATIAGYIYSFKLYHKQKGQLQIQDIPDVKGAIGVVKGKEGDYYKVEFPEGLLGERIHLAYSQEELKEGDKVKVIDLRGNLLKVEKV